MNAYGILFGTKNLSKAEIENKRIIEVGAYDVNGSLRSFIELFNPREYVGVDITKGPGVDVICDVKDLITTFGHQSFDLVISTELLEHVKDWQACIHNLKGVCKPNGVILITTRSYGCLYHGYPYDFWRFEKDDMLEIFEDFKILNIEVDPETGIFIKAFKPEVFNEKDLSRYQLYSIVSNERISALQDNYNHSFYYRKLIFKERLRHYLYRKVNLFISKL